MKYKCIISDLDFTIIGPKNSFSEKNRYALQTLMDNGIIFIPASGRALKSYPNCILEMSGLKYLITSNGVTIYDVLKKRNIYKSIVRKNLGQEILNLVDAYPVTYEIFIDGEAYTDKSYFDLPEKILCYNGKEYETKKNLDGLKNYIKNTRKPVDDIRSFMLDNCDNIECIDIISPPEYRSEIHNLVAKNINDIYHTTSGSHLIEISAPNTGKSQAMFTISDLLGIRPEEMVAFGDGDNDSEMLKNAGIGVAVMNATDKCKNASDMVTDYFYNDGVYHALLKIYPDIL